MPRQSRSPVLAAALAIMLLLGLAGCRSSAAPPAASAPSAQTPSQPASSSPAASSAPAPPSGPLEVIKMADAKALPSAPLYIAIEKGYFREQGIEAQLEHVAGGA